MGFKKIVRDFILRFDLFSTPASLRYKGEPCYQSIQCGLFSLIIVGLFIAMFASPIIDVLTKAQITATTTITDSPSSTAQVSNIQFAVNMKGVELMNMLSHFQFIVRTVVHEKGGDVETQRAQLVPCTLPAWEKQGQKIKDYFTRLSMSEMLCIPDGFNSGLFGSEGQDSWSQLELKINRCKNSTFTTCSNSSQFQAFVENHLDSNDFFDVRILVLDNILRIQNQNPVGKTINRDIFLSFTATMGSRAEVAMATYDIVTDQSIWPWSQEEKVQGSFLERASVISTGLRTDRFAWVSFYKSTYEMEADRNYGKIDDLLAYIGGFFSLIFFVLLFFFASFNEYRYELMVGERCFSYDGGKSKEVEEGDMGLLGYLCYQIYQWMNMLGVNLPWKKMEKVHKVRVEACEQLDVCYIIRKLQYLEQVLENALDKKLMIFTSIVKPKTLEEARLNRKITLYYHKLLSYQSRRAKKEVLTYQEPISQEMLFIQSEEEPQVGKQNLMEKKSKFKQFQSQLENKVNPKNSIVVVNNTPDQILQLRQTYKNKKNSEDSSQNRLKEASIANLNSKRIKQQINHENEQKSKIQNELDPVTAENVSEVLIKSIAELRKQQEKKNNHNNNNNKARKNSETNIDYRSKKNMDPSSKNMIITNQVLDKESEDYFIKQDKNCYQKLVNFFNDSPDSGDERAQKIIHNAYYQMYEKQPQRFMPLQHKVSLEMKKSLVKQRIRERKRRNTMKLGQQNE